MEKLNKISMVWTAAPAERLPAGHLPPISLWDGQRWKTAFTYSGNAIPQNPNTVKKVSTKMTVSQLDQLPGFTRLGGPTRTGRSGRSIAVICSVWLWHGLRGLCLGHGHGQYEYVAVATLADAACIVLAENAAIPEECIRKPLTRGLR